MYASFDSAVCLRVVSLKHTFCCDAVQSNSDFNRNQDFSLPTEISLHSKKPLSTFVQLHLADLRSLRHIVSLREMIKFG